ncbi:aconitase/3-isopropylmalate dehydratase large subunit family protein, partial [Achromobacter sp. UBA5777]|uniref:aconitase/3-isopropylmalate dehydratase large subunit family protein n=1 Tax=Achromobacter sp. UBA5777 TaxID=1945913 RepID=UPI0025C73353
MAQPQTLAQKLIAAACGRETVAEGEIVTCAVDLAMFHDSSGPRRLKPMLEELGATLWDPSRIVLVIDHYVPESDDESRRIVRIARDWAAEQQLPNVYDSVGICHVVVPQHGHIRPGMFCVGGDSHSPTGGAFGAYMFGIGSTEMLGVAVTGQIWVKVPKTLMMHWRGQLAAGVTAKDMMLHMIGRYGMNGGRYQAVEFCGEAVRALSMQERMTLSNMSAELGSQVGLIAPDETTAAWLRDAGVTQELDLVRWQSDSEADAEWHEFDAAALAPQVAAPHSPANARGVDTYNDVPVQVAYIGACTGAKLEDLRAAATVLRGRRLADGMQLMVAPASRQDQDQADREGVMQVLRDAGAQVLATSCGACAGYGGAIPGG